MADPQENEVYGGEGVAEETLSQLFERVAERHAERPAQRYKGGVYDRSLAGVAIEAASDGEYETLTYAEMREIVRRLAAGFRAFGIERGERVGICAGTRLEWAQCDFALLAAGAVVTTVYRSSSSEQIRYLLDDPGATGVVVEDEAILERVLAVEDELDLEFVVSMDELDRFDDRDDVYTLADVFEEGVSRFDEGTYESWLEHQDLQDLASLIYTSGTTGQPKGVRLTHGNFRANVDQLAREYGPGAGSEDAPTIDSSTRTVSYLPLAHVFERLAGHFFIFVAGGCVAYAESPDTLKEDFELVGPTVATSVPRVYEKIYDTLREEASTSPIKRRIFEWATDVCREYYRAPSPGIGLRAKMALADRLVFGKVRAALGGDVEFLVSGGGTLSADLCTLYHGMGLPIYEGYGLTEASPVVTTNPPEEPKIGTIGTPVHGCEIAVDPSVVPAESTSDTLGDLGELLVRGPNVTDGYWNKPEKTDEAFLDELPPRARIPSSVTGTKPEDAGSESEGPGSETDSPGSVPDAAGGSGKWFRTGDIVKVRPDGYLVFYERSKELLVLSTGKNVAPGPIEDAFVGSEVVEQCMVLGDDEKFVGALLVPNFDAVASIAAEEGTDLPDDPAAICEDERAIELVDEAVRRVNEGFEDHERIKRFRLVPEEFTEENGMLTPSMKKKRRVILERYDEQVADIYREEKTSDTDPDAEEVRAD